VWFDIGPHLFDHALVLFGIPEAIGADIRIERDGGRIDDAFDVTLYYPRIRAFLRASMLRPPVGPTWTVNGTKASFIKYGMDPQEAALKEGRTPDEPDWDMEPPELYGKLITPNEREQFLRCAPVSRATMRMCGMPCSERRSSP